MLALGGSGRERGFCHGFEDADDAGAAMGEAAQDVHAIAGARTAATIEP